MKFETMVVRIKPKHERAQSRIVFSEVTDTESAPPALVEESFDLLASPTGQAEAGRIPSYGRAAVDPESLYPHVFDTESQPGRARTELISALEAAEGALDSFDDSDLVALSSRLSGLAVTLRAACVGIEANDALASFVSYVRRAVLVADVTEATRSSLNALVSALRSVTANPIIDLADAAELADSLSAHGWNGSNSHVAALVRAFLEADDQATTAVAPSSVRDASGEMV